MITLYGKELGLDALMIEMSMKGKKYQFRSDPREVTHYFDTVLFQMLAGPNTTTSKDQLI